MQPLEAASCYAKTTALVLHGVACNIQKLRSASALGPTDCTAPSQHSKFLKRESLATYLRLCRLKLDFTYKERMDLYVSQNTQTEGTASSTSRDQGLQPKPAASFPKGSNGQKNPRPARGRV